MNNNIEIYNKTLEFKTLENLTKDLKENLKNLVNSLTVSSTKSEVAKNNLNTVMFISFDIVNSSLYKSSNYSGWFKVIYSLLNYVYKTIVKDIQDIKLWRTIGDELVFVVNIYDIKDVGEYTQIIFEALTNINKYIKEGKLFKGDSEALDDLIENNLLELKATAWIARVSEIISDKDLDKNITGNICYYYDGKINIISDEEDREKFREYQGKDIDLGFRIASKNTIARRLSLSVELAYILAENEQFKQKIHIVGYNNLKGVWNGKPYPIIWYHDVYISGCKLEDSFSYDEDEGDVNNIISNYFNRSNSEKIRDRMYNNPKSELDKVIKDRNLTNKINAIKKSIRDSEKISNENIKNKADEALEVHCVAVCVNQDNNKVLMFKRADKKGSRFGGKWDFGCAKVARSWTFKESLKTAYKNFANLDITIQEPFRDYNFEDSDTGVIIPGIRYKAVVKYDCNIQLNLNKYIDYKWVDLNEFNHMEQSGNGQSVFIDYEEFKEIIETVLREGDKL